MDDSYMVTRWWPKSQQVQCLKMSQAGRPCPFSPDASPLRKAFWDHSAVVASSQSCVRGYEGSGKRQILLDTLTYQG